MSGSGSGSGVDTDAGASGSSSSSFSLGTGGLIAIIVVVAVVVIAAVAVSVLWYLAKRRQWDVRASIRRASRRLTGRGPEPGYVKQRSGTSGQPVNNRTRRSGLRMENLPPSSKSHTRTNVTEVRDLEKGMPPNRVPKQTPKQTLLPAPTMTGKSWVDKLHVATS